MVLPTLAPSQTAEVRVTGAALRCIARWGLAKTTLDDIAREAGCSRATVYRLFPGGKSSLIALVGQHEVARLLLAVIDAIDESPDLEQLLVSAIGAAAGFLDENEALDMLAAHEPELLLPFLAFDRLDPLLAAASGFLGPIVSRFVDPSAAGELVEWAARLVISYTFIPSESFDLTEPADVTRLVRTHLLPGVHSAKESAPQLPVP